MRPKRFNELVKGNLLYAVRTALNEEGYRSADLIAQQRGAYITDLPIMFVIDTDVPKKYFPNNKLFTFEVEAKILTINKKKYLIGYGVTLMNLTRPDGDKYYYFSTSVKIIKELREDPCSSMFERYYIINNDYYYLIDSNTIINLNY